ncbi:MAG: AraC family transcriptional regulator [Bacteroidetes bacterium]|nr:AraC family transcriptional regulator [Bacteroidota bacterium]
MTVDKHIPDPALRPFVKSLLIIESGEGMENRILPDTALVMAFRCNGVVHHRNASADLLLPSSLITGIRQSYRIVGYGPGTTMLLVTFTETGAASFFLQPLHELEDCSLPLELLLPRQELSEVEERLAEAETNAQRFAVLEAFLRSRLQEDKEDPIVRQAIQSIRTAKGDIRVKDLLQELHISRDPFEKRFRRITGSSPKHFAGIIRLRGLIDNYAQRNNLTDAAHAAGYFDQAHFNKHFKAFTGQTPMDFFRLPAQW